MSQEEFIAFVKSHPGTTIKEAKTNIKGDCINSTMIKAVLRDGLVTRIMENNSYRYSPVVT